MQLQEALAVWGIFHPTAVQKADQWCRANKVPGGLAYAYLDVKQLKKLAAHLGSDPATGCALLRIMEQCHGDVAVVPPGYPHVVQFCSLR